MSEPGPNRATALDVESAAESPPAPRRPSLPRRWRALSAGLVAGVLVGSCTTSWKDDTGETLTPEQGAQRVAQYLPESISDRSGWASDIYTAFAALHLAASPRNICSVVAIAEQESGFKADPAVPGLARIAWKQIDERAAAMHIPQAVVHAALKLKSSNGESYAERIDKAKTERDLSLIFDDMVDRVPLGKRFLADSNPIRTGGPMQVSVSYAESFAKKNVYPYTVQTSIRDEVFSRRGGVYFGTANLLDYPAPYETPLYRFADYNAGHYASRNAAFQSALSRISGIRLALDGDLVLFDSDQSGATERAARLVATRLNLRESSIHRDLEQGTDDSFERTRLYQRVFEQADKDAGKPLPRAVLPQIRLESPKITRRLTTAWFAERVQGRYERCLARAPAQPAN